MKRSSVLRIEGKDVDQTGMEGLAAIGMIGTLFMLLVGLLWLIIPFAIFGIKPLLKQLIAEQKRTNELLASRTH